MKRLERVRLDSILSAVVSNVLTALDEIERKHPDVIVTLTGPIVLRGYLVPMEEPRAKPDQLPTIYYDTNEGVKYPVSEIAVDVKRTPNK